MIAGFFLALGYLAYLKYSRANEESALERAKFAQQTRIRYANRRDLTNQVNAMAEKYGAIVDWPLKLAGGKSRRRTLVLSTELQSLWISGIPILFIGRLEDVSAISSSISEIRITYDGTLRHPKFLNTELRVDLNCTSENLAATIGREIDSTSGSLKENIAVVANIENIEFASLTKSEQGPETRLTGVGTCESLMYLPDRLLGPDESL